MTTERQQDQDKDEKPKRPLRLLHFIKAHVTDLDPSVKDGTTSIKASLGGVNADTLADLWNLAQAGELQVVLLPSQAVLGANDANSDIQLALEDVLRCTSMSPETVERCWKRVAHDADHESRKGKDGHSWPTIQRCEEEHKISQVKCLLYPGHAGDHASLNMQGGKFSWARVSDKRRGE